MSVHISSDVWRHSKAKGATLLVLLSLADQANDEGQCWPKVETIAERCRISRASVHRHLQQLLDLGELGWANRSAAGLPNVYTITVSTPSQIATPPVADCDPPRLTGETTPVSTVRQQEPSLEPSLEEPSPAGADDAKSAEREDVERLCVRLADRIEANGSKRPTITKAWRQAARLLLDQDGKTEAQVERAIDWCQRDQFWQGNVMSMPTLRRQYDRLRLRAMQDGARFEAPAPEKPKGPPAELLGDPAALERWYDEQMRERRRPADG